MRKAGESHHNARCTDAQVEEARTLRDERPDMWSYTALAEKFGCSWETARDWITYRTRTGGNEIKWNAA